MPLPASRFSLSLNMPKCRPRCDHAAIKLSGLSDLDPLLRYDAANDSTVNSHFPGYKLSLKVLCVRADGEVMVWHFNTAVYAAL